MMETSQEKKWFVFIDEKPEGPMTVDEAKVRSVTAGPKNQTYVWTEGMADWVPLSEVEVFKEHTNIGNPISVAPPIALPHAETRTEVVKVDEQPSAWDVEIDKSKSDLSLPEKTKTNLGLQPPHGTKSFSFSGIKTSLRRLFWIFKLVLGTVLFCTFVTIAGLFYSSNFDVAALPWLIELRDQIQPALRVPAFKVAAQYPVISPILAKVIPPLPKIDGVQEADLRTLNEAASRAIDPALIQIATVVGGSAERPVFYVAGNLPDSLGIIVTVTGIRETLIDPKPYSEAIPGVVKDRLATIKLSSDQSTRLSKGQYIVGVTEAPTQLEAAASQFISTIPAQGKNRISFSKQFFLGGKKDAEYQKTLDELHARLRMQAEGEVSGLTGLLNAFEITLSELAKSYEAIRGIKKSNQRSAEWAKKRSQVQDLLKEAATFFEGKTSEGLMQSQIYAKTYIQAFDIYVRLGQYIQALEKYFTSKSAAKSTMEIQLGSAVSEINPLMDNFRGRVPRIAEMFAKSSGLPPQEF